MSRLADLTGFIGILLGVFALASMALNCLPYYSAASEGNPASAQPAIAIEARDGTGAGE